MFYKKIFFFTLLLISSALKAEPFFEPYAGASLGLFDQNITNVSGTTSSGGVINGATFQVAGNFSGAAIGLRVYEKYLDQFILGGDGGFAFSSGRLDLNVFNSLGEYQITTFTPGIIVGWDIPTWLLPRIWAGFYPINSLSLTLKGNSKGDSFSGYSYKFGLSFDWWIQLGFEFSQHVYSAINGEKLPYRGTFNGITMTLEKIEYSEVIVSISYPFSLK